MAEMHIAVNRRVGTSHPGLAGNGPQADREIFLPEERLDLATSIAAFTMGSAYVNHLDDVTGSIEVGKFADLAVVDRDLFAHPPDQIADARVDATFVEGVAVYERPTRPDR